MEKQLGVSLAVKKILGGYSLLDVENAIVDELFTRDVTEEETTEETTDSKYPLTETQFGIYSECMLSPDSTIYNIPYSYRLDTLAGAERLRDALQKVIDAHSAVKCTIEADENGDIFMIPHSEREAAVELVHGSEDECQAYWKAFSRPFDFADTLYRITVYETDKYLYLMMDFHHIMFDGTSLGIFINDLNSVLAGKEIESEAKSIFDFAKKEQKLLKYMNQTMMSIQLTV